MHAETDGRCHEQIPPQKRMLFFYETWRVIFLAAFTDDRGGEIPHIEAMEKWEIEDSLPPSRECEYVKRGGRGKREVV